MNREFGLDAETKRFIELLREKPAKAVAEELGISVSAVYERLYRLRDKRYDWQVKTNQLNNYAKDHRLHFLLTKTKKKRVPPDKWDEEP